MPPEGIEKAPATPGNPRVAPRLKQAGEAVGIDFTGKCPRYPNTLAAHALIESVIDDTVKQNALMEAVFKAYFTDGIYPDVENLTKIAESCGLDKNRATQVMTDKSKLDAAFEAAVEWSRKGVSGVPMFFMNGQKMVSGAQNADALARLIEIAAEKFPLKSTQGAGSSL